MNRLHSFLAELRRRRVPHVTAAYAAVAFVILQVAALVFPALPLPAGAYALVVALLALGFPVAALLAWARGATARGRRVAEWLAVALVVLAAGVLAFDVGGARERLRGTGGVAVIASPVSVAVLPFANLSGDPVNDYFSDGMTEELISRLARVEALQVAARTSVLQYRGAASDVRAIGRELGVRYIVEGGVRRAGDRVRITAQLIDAATGFHVWSHEYDERIDDIFALQERTALQIARALDVRLGPDEQRAVRRSYTDNLAAYDEYLRGWALVESFTGLFDDVRKLEAAHAHFEAALALDSAYALALSGLSQVEAFYFFFNVDRQPDRLQRAEQLARRALAGDAQLGEAHVALGDVLATRGEWTAAVAAYRSGLTHSPSYAYGWQELAWALQLPEVQDLAAAEHAARQAIRLAPGMAWAHYQLGQVLRRQSRLEDAVTALEHALFLHPQFGQAWHALGHVHLLRGDYERAVALFSTPPDGADAPELLFDLSVAYAGYGDAEGALAGLARALAAGYREFARIDSTTEYAALRDDRRFAGLVARYR